MIIYYERKTKSDLGRTRHHSIAAKAASAENTHILLFHGLSSLMQLLPCHMHERVNACMARESISFSSTSTRRQQ
jgi:hypothetical protein